MSSSEQKRQWKKDAKQLKDDLDNRTKVIKKREIPITFPDKKKEAPPPPHDGSSQTDHYFKDQINFT